MKRSMLLGLPVDYVPDATAVAETLHQRLLCRQSTIVTFVNPYSFYVAQRSAECSTFEQFDLVLPDGIGVVWAMRWCRARRVTRVSFDPTSLHEPLFRRLDASKARVYVTGARPGVAEMAVARMANVFPGIEFVGVSDGFGEAREIAEQILKRDPDLVLCGMGVPRQENFALMLRDAGYDGIVCTCGGFLDQYAQGDRYYPAWVDGLNLRWAYRLAREPRRLWRRYLLLYPQFIWHAFVEGLRWRMARQ